MTDEAHTSPGSAGAPGPGAGTRALPAARRGLGRFGRWLATWGRRLAPSPFLWVGAVLGFGTSLLVWESVLLLGVVVWLLGVWLWKARGRHVLVALGLGMVLGWLPMLFFFVTSLPHTMIGLPGVEYDL
ncbi:hypothetical protein ACFO6V_11705 [Promicromonospora alba]|uniref:Apolipoprotein N-acyltransferase n=1 Tax=Promicromonospora alba TaxID=1616110 RepID=A0ABV9HF38_9MICO